MSDRAEERRLWGTVAAGWEKHVPRHRDGFMPVTAWMLDAARLQPGSRVLELAAGTGEVGLMAYELIQPGGSLLLSDWSPEMLSVAQREAEERGLGDVRFKQIDAQNLDIEAASLDAVLMRWGLMFMPDPEAALRSMRRVLRPGGRVSLAAWTTAEENPWSSVVGRVLVPRGHAPAPDPNAPGQFALGGEGVLQELLEAAGFVDEIDVEAVEVRDVTTFERWWERATEMSRMGRIVEALDPAERESVRSELRDRLAEYEGEDGVLSIPGRTWVAAATA